MVARTQHSQYCFLGFVLQLKVALSQKKKKIVTLFFMIETELDPSLMDYFFYEEAQGVRDFFCSVLC